MDVLNGFKQLNDEFINTNTNGLKMKLSHAINVFDCDELFFVAKNNGLIYDKNIAEYIISYGLSNELYAICIIKFMEKYHTTWDSDCKNCWNVGLYDMINAIDTDYFSLTKKNIVATFAGSIPISLEANKLKYNLRLLFAESGGKLKFNSTLDLIQNNVSYEDSNLASSAWLINSFWENKPINAVSKQRPILLTAIALANKVPQEILG